jgi:hypothetical protein
MEEWSRLLPFQQPAPFKIRKVIEMEKKKRLTNTEKFEIKDRRLGALERFIQISNSDKMRDYFIAKFEEEEKLYGSREWESHYPTEGMKKDRIISGLIKKYPLMCTIPNELERQENGEYVYLRKIEGLEHTIGEHVIPEHKVKGKIIKAHVVKEMKYSIFFFVPDAKFYRLILPRLGIAKITLQKYLFSYSCIGWLKILNELPAGIIKKKQMCYGVGYEMKQPGEKPRLIRFMKEKNFPALRTFELPYSKIY